MIKIKTYTDSVISKLIGKDVPETLNILNTDTGITANVLL